MVKEKQIDSSVWWFFVIAFAFTWGCQFPLTLTSREIIPDGPFVRTCNSLATLGPLFAACALTFYKNGRKGLIDLLKLGWNLRFRRIWWLPILLLVPVMQYGAVVVSSLIEEGRWPQIGTLNLSSLFFSLMVIVIQVIGEEFGWRGYAISRLQTRWNAVIASLILGLFWGAWHLQLWMRVGEVARTSPYLATQFYIFAQAIIYTWLYNNTGGSLLPVLIYHTLDNFFGSKVFGIYDSFLSSIVYFTIVLTTTIIIVAIWKPKYLIREKKNTLEAGCPTPRAADLAVHAVDKIESS